MSFYEAVTAPTVAAVIHDHLDLLSLVLCHRLVRRDVAVAAVLIVTALTAHGHVVADELGTLFAREAVYDTRNLSHVFLYPTCTMPYIPSIIIQNQKKRLLENLRRTVSYFQDSVVLCDEVTSGGQM